MVQSFGKNNRKNGVLRITALILCALTLLICCASCARISSLLDPSEPSYAPLPTVDESGETATSPSPAASAGPAVEPDPATSKPEESRTEVSLTFASKKLLEDHYKKHGIEMGFQSAEAYLAAANRVVNNPAALHKLEAEDGDDVYYVEATNEFVVVSAKGYIRTYFLPSGGKAYYDRQ